MTDIHKTRQLQLLSEQLRIYLRHREELDIVIRTIEADMRGLQS